MRGAKPVDDALYIATYLGISVAAGVAGVLVHTPLLKLTAAALALKSGVSARLKSQLSRVLVRHLPGHSEISGCLPSIHPRRMVTPPLKPASSDCCLSCMASSQARQCEARGSYSHTAQARTSLC